MEIRVVIEVPKEDEEKREDVIESILDLVKEKMPNLSKAKRPLPVTVMIRELNEELR